MTVLIPFRIPLLTDTWRLPQAGRNVLNLPGNESNLDA